MSFSRRRGGRREVKLQPPLKEFFFSFKNISLLVSQRNLTWGITFIAYNKISFKWSSLSWTLCIILWSNTHNIWTTKQVRKWNKEKVWTEAATLVWHYEMNPKDLLRNSEYAWSLNINRLSINWLFCVKKHYLDPQNKRYNLIKIYVSPLHIVTIIIHCCHIYRF